MDTVKEARYGSRREEAIRYIEAFEEMWPFAPFGPAHIVVADLNLEDSNILYCAGLCVETLRKRGLGSGVEYSEFSDDELRNTAIFLLSLMVIPEDDRISPDYYDEEDEG